MADIVGIGSNVYDTLIVLPHFPQEDTKMRIEKIIKCGGGPCGTGLVAAAKLGAKCAYIGNLAEDEGGRFLLQDMERFSMDNRFVNCINGYRSFLSFVLLNQDKGTRTCIADRGDLPELALTEQQKQAVRDAQILMVDGNELPAAVEGAKIASKSGTRVLYDAGGLYDNIEQLLPYSDILIPSEEFALGHTGEKTVQKAAEKLFALYRPEIVVITQGAKGGIFFDGKEIRQYPSFPVEVVDSNGAGDAFHGAFAFALTKGFSCEQCCLFASAVSAVKCTHMGAREGIPNYSETITFLKERGRNEF